MKGLPITVLDAPSNLGLRPPEEGAIPGCYKMPWALRDRKLLQRLGARDAGAVVPPRYRAQWRPGDGDRNAIAIAKFSEQLAERIGRIIDASEFPLVLGGDCSILIGNMLALKRRGSYGLIFLDAHSDFRHEGNAPAIGAAAGEDLAIMTGRGDARLTNITGQGPYVNAENIALIGVRPTDDCLVELKGLEIAAWTSNDLHQHGISTVVGKALEVVTRQTKGFWLHLDFDVVDESEMRAVDCPEPDGLSFADLTQFVGSLVVSPQCVGMELTIYDPDLDPDDHQADAIVQFLQDVFQAEAP